MGKFYPLVLALFCGVFPGRAQSIHFDRLDINDGLSQNTVTSIIQDDKGFMWFGTKDGLCRYDGKSFKTFMHDPRLTTGLGNSLIKCLVEDHDRRIWVGTDSGLYIYDPEMEHFSAVPLYADDGKPVTKPVPILDCDREGRVWIVVENNDVFCYDPQTRQVECRYKPRKTLRSLASDKNGVIWFAGYGGGLYYTGGPVCERQTVPRRRRAGDLPQGHHLLHLFERLQRDVPRSGGAGRCEAGPRHGDGHPAAAVGQSRGAALRAAHPAILARRTVDRDRVGHRRLQHPHPALPAPEKFPVRSLFAFGQCRLFALQGPRGRIVDRFLLRRHQLPAPAEFRFRKVLPHRRSAQPPGAPRARDLPGQRRAALDRHGGRRALPVRPRDPVIRLLRPEPGVHQRPRTADGRGRPLGEHLLERASG